MLPSEPLADHPSWGWALMASELRVLFGRRRTWAMLLALAAVPVLIAVAVRLSSSGPTPGRGPAFLDRITQNGLFVGITGLVISIPLFLPLTVGVVAGDTIAGEAGMGTLRYLLVAPAGRLRLLVVKYVAAVLFCAAATGTVAVAGSVIGALLFPVGPVTLLSGDTIGAGESVLRPLLVAAYVTVSLPGLSAIGLFISHPHRRAGRGDGGHRRALGRLAGARRAAAAGLAAPLAVQPLLARLRRPAAPAGLLGLVRRQRAAAGRLRRRLRGAGLRPVRHQGRAVLSLG